MTTQTLEKPQLQATALLGKLLKAWRTGRRHLWIEGGTWASKTFSIIQALKLIAENHPEPLHITITSETMPHLKRGCILDFKTIMGEDFNDDHWNKTDFIYKFSQTGSWIEFTSADVPSKFTGGRRDILFANEANHINRDTFRQADMRTRLFTIADWNPECEFWFHEEECVKSEASEYVLRDPEDGVYIRTTYLDALEVLPDAQRKFIEDLEEKSPNDWRIYGLGLLGKIEGLVYPYFTQVDSLPAGDYFYGLDFGFSDDPAALTKNVIVGDALYSQELIYETGLTNDVLARKMDLLGIRKNYDEIFADAAEPKSIEELHLKGFNVKPCEKGKGSVEFGIQKVNQYKQLWTKDSLNAIKEQRNFRYIPDKDGKLTEKATHKWSHLMDSRRYAMSSHIDRVGGGHKVKVRYVGASVEANARFRR